MNTSLEEETHELEEATDFRKLTEEMGKISDSDIQKHQEWMLEENLRLRAEYYPEGTTETLQNTLDYWRDWERNPFRSQGDRQWKDCDGHFCSQDGKT